MADLTPRRLTRSDWLVEALEVLALEGEAELRIDHLAAHLGESDMARLQPGRCGRRASGS